MSAPGIARVLIDSPLPQLDHLFDYRVPESMVADAVAGVRVVVPWRGNDRGGKGYIVELVSEADFTGTLAPITELVSPVPVLTDEVWQVARRAADRAAGNASGILRLAIPGRAVRVEKAWLAGREGAVAPVAAIPAHSAEYPARLAEALDAHGRIALEALPGVSETEQGETVGQWARTLAEIAVTRLAAGESAIIAVPDYRDLDQLALVLADLAPEDSVVRLDAKQANPDRYRAFLTALEAVPRIIIGNRSAVYAPAHNLGLIMLWSDGDPLFAEPLAPYVHARDAALVRQQLSGCALVLASLARSVPTQRLVELRFLEPIGPERRRLPHIVLTAQQDLGEGPAAAARIPSPAWLAISQAVKTGPVLIQVARPGYAPMLACKRCGEAARCTACHGPLGIPSRGANPACTLCGAPAGAWSCVHCEATEFRLVTRGSGRTAEELGRAFPTAKVIVADGERTVQTVPDEPALIVATRGAEPVAAGGYRAVLLLDGDRMLGAESLSIAEDCLRWWSHAAALASPGAQILLVGVTGPLAHSFATWQQAEFAAAELADRRTLRFPPAVRLATISGAEDVVAEALDSLAELLPASDRLGPVTTNGQSRAVLRCDYGAAADVARELKAKVIEVATKRRSPRAGAQGFRPAPQLRVRFDDPEIEL